MFQRLRPWQAAAALTGLLVAAQVLLQFSASDSSSGSVEQSAALLVSPSEIAVTAGFLLLVFLILWLIFALVARAKIRRQLARDARGAAPL